MLFKLVLFSTFFSLCFYANGQYPQTTANGQYLGQAVAVPNPRPTLIYNCALMPSICRNVANWVGTNPARQLPRNFHLHASTGTHTADRRDNSCPDDWKETHVCPEPNQPQSRGWWRKPAGVRNTYSFPSTAKLIPSIHGNPFINEIAMNLINDDSAGLAYTCDEFPPASWIEGGTNTWSATTYCAPQSLSCKGTQWRTHKRNYKGLGQIYPQARSEQDWQSTSHSHLSTFAKGIPAQVMQFVFSTTSVAPGATPNAAYVVLNGATRTVSLRKRDAEMAKTAGDWDGIPTPRAGDGVQVIVTDAKPTPEPELLGRDIVEALNTWELPPFEDLPAVEKNTTVVFLNL